MEKRSTHFFCDGTPFCNSCGQRNWPGWKRRCDTSKGTAEPPTPCPHLGPSPADPNYLAPWTPSEKLGDWTERQLKKLGVTEERYKEAKEKFGLAAECNCAGRKEWLNAVSIWWQSITDQQKDHNEG